MRECKDGNLLEFAVSNGLLADIIWNGRVSDGNMSACGKTAVAVCHEWQRPRIKGIAGVVGYDQRRGVDLRSLEAADEGQWLVVSDGRFVTEGGLDRIRRHVSALPADIVLVNLTPQLAGYHEKVRVTPKDNIVGWRRYYHSSIHLCEMPDDWPHYVFIRTRVRDKVAPQGVLTLDFDEFIALCSANALNVVSLKAAGRAIRLDSPEGLLTAVCRGLDTKCLPDAENTSRSAGVRTVGKVIFGANVSARRLSVIMRKSATMPL